MYLVWSFAGGPEFQSGASFAGVPQGTLIKLGGGAGLLLGESRRFQIGPEMKLCVAKYRYGANLNPPPAIVKFSFATSDAAAKSVGTNSLALWSDNADAGWGKRR